MDLLYGRILGAVTSWWGKLSAATLIGLIALGSYGYKDGGARSTGIPWLIVGGVLGFTAGVLLLLHDYGQSPAPNRGAAVPGDRETRWPKWAVPVMAAGLVVCFLVAHFIWTILSLTS